MGGNPRDTEILEAILVLLTSMEAALDDVETLLDDIKTNTTP
jgi:hypothetical protein